MQKEKIIRRLANLQDLLSLVLQDIESEREMVLQLRRIGSNTDRSTAELSRRQKLHIEYLTEFHALLLELDTARFSQLNTIKLISPHSGGRDAVAEWRQQQLQITG